MRLEGSGDGKRHAKRLRKEMTPPESGLWLALRRNEAGLHFRKQHAASEGSRVLRNPATEVLTNLEGVVRQIVAIALERRERFES